MALGFFLILGIRDSFKIILEDLALEVTDQEEQQKIIVDMQVYRKVFSLILSALFTVILVYQELLVVMIILLMLTIIELMINGKLYKKILKFKETI